MKNFNLFPISPYINYRCIYLFVTLIADTLIHFDVGMTKWNEQQAHHVVIISVYGAINTVDFFNLLFMYEV